MFYTTGANKASKIYERVRKRREAEAAAAENAGGTKDKPFEEDVADISQDEGMGIGK